ncbi:uncharacterized protein BDV17DRAFT_280388 [Aspergillus undulatus]|uniref:uncharacterized protein n=1 Tax=Aspergillus undulatus TaxID=1810928 RepID=UPI003CCE3351
MSPYSDSEDMAEEPGVSPVIGTGPAGISALKALSDEKAFDKVRAFERRDSPGGTWNYDETPSPTTFPQTTSPAIPLDGSIPTAMYSWLDTNVLADLMAFTHTPFPDGNSPISTERYGARNATRPWTVVSRYLLSVVERFRGFIEFNTTVTSVEKTESGRWKLTLRQPQNESQGGEASDSWWQEEFDAVVVGTGQYNVPFLPKIPGLEEAVKSHPEALEHVNAFRSPDHYTGKKVLVNGPLYVSQGSHSPYITEIWHLPDVEVKPTIGQVEAHGPKLQLTFSDGSQLGDVDKIIFATGYRLPIMAVLGLVRAPLLFRMIEYEAVVVARYYAGRGGELPSKEDQERWEAEQVKLKGDSYKFHDFLRNLAGPLSAGTDGYDLPEIAYEWLEKCFYVLLLKDVYWGKVRREAEAQI